MEVHCGGGKDLMEWQRIGGINVGGGEEGIVEVREVLEERCKL